MNLAGRDTKERSPFPEVVCNVVFYIPREFSKCVTPSALEIV